MHILVGDWHGPLDVLRAAIWATRTDLFHLTTRIDQSDDSRKASIRFAVAEMAST